MDNNAIYITHLFYITETVCSNTCEMVMIAVNFTLCGYFDNVFTCHILLIMSKSMLQILLQSFVGISTGGTGWHLWAHSQVTWNKDKPTVANIISYENQGHFLNFLSNLSEYDPPFCWMFCSLFSAFCCSQDQKRKWCALQRKERITAMHWSIYCFVHR